MKNFALLKRAQRQAMLRAKPSSSLIVLETERLLLRPFELTDREALYEMHQDNRVGKFTGGIRSRSDSLLSLETMIENFRTRGRGTMAIVEKDNPSLAIGWCGVKPLTNTEDYEVVYGLSAQFWKKGYATEAARVAMADAFGNLTLERIVALVYADNIASIRVLKKLGMSYRKEVFFKPADSYASLFMVSAPEFLTTYQSSS